MTDRFEVAADATCERSGAAAAVLAIAAVAPTEQRNVSMQRLNVAQQRSAIGKSLWPCERGIVNIH